MNGDTFINEDIEKVFKSHDHKNDVCTVLYAIDKIDGKEKSTGVYIFSQSVFDYLRKPKVFNLKDRLKDIPHKIYHSKNTFVDIGTHEGLKYAKENLFV